MCTDIESHSLLRLRRFFAGGLHSVEYVGFLLIAFATTVAMFHEVTVMVSVRLVHLGDLLLMFLYLEVLAMIGQYFKMGEIPVRFPLFIVMVAMARYLILDVKEMTDWRILSVTAAIFLLARAVLALRYGDVRLSNCEEASEGIDSPR